METWLRDGPELDRDIRHLSGVAGLGMIALNREAAENGICYGGVALVWKESFGVFKRIDIKNPDRFEVLVCAGSWLWSSATFRPIMIRRENHEAWSS